MLYYILKIFVSAFVIVVISEIAKRHSGFAALVASLPLTSLLAMIWMHFDGVESAKIAELSGQIFWLVMPSLLLFLLLPLLLKQGLGFWLSLGLSVTTTVTCYMALLPLLRRLGVQLYTGVVSPFLPMIRVGMVNNYVLLLLNWVIAVTTFH